MMNRRQATRLGALISAVTLLGTMTACTEQRASSDASPSQSPSPIASPLATSDATDAPSAATPASPATPAASTSMIAEDFTPLFVDSLSNFNRDGAPAIDSAGDLAAFYRYTASSPQLSANVSVAPASKYGIKTRADVDNTYPQLFASLKGKNFAAYRGIYCAEDMAGTDLAADCVAANHRYVLVVFGKALDGQTDGKQLKDFAADFWENMNKFS